MRIARLALIASSSLFLFGCALADTRNEGGEANPPESSALMPLHRVDATPTELLVEVTSNGCTRAEDISAKVEHDRGQQRITIARLKPDYCRRMPFAIPVTITAEDFGLDLKQPYQVLNPITAAPGS